MIYSPRFWRAAFVTCCALLSARAGAQQAAPDLKALERQTEQLKAQVLEIDETGQALERKLVYPDETRVTVFFGDTVSGLLVDRVVVGVDNSPMAEYRFPQKVAIALLLHGLQNVLAVNAQTGPHRLHAQFFAHWPDSKPGDEPVSGDIDQPFFKDQRPLEITLVVDTVGIVNKPVIVMTAASSAQ